MEQADERDKRRLEKTTLEKEYAFCHKLTSRLGC
jgi:hypothetical protein